MVEMRFRMRVAVHAACVRPDRGVLRTDDGAKVAAVAYAEAREKAMGRIVQSEGSSSGLSPDRGHGPLSLEELGFEVRGPALGMSAGAGGEPANGLAAAVELLRKSGQAAMESLPKAQRTGIVSLRAVSERTKLIQAEQRAKMEKLCAEGKEEAVKSRRQYNKAFTESRRRDLRDVVDNITSEMEAAYKAGNASALHSKRRQLPGSKRRSEFGIPTHDAAGQRFQSLDAVLQWWHTGMCDHWRATEAEAARPELEEVFRAVRENSPDLSDGRLDQTLAKMKLGKGVGEDGIPVELFEAVEAARQDLYTVVRQVFSTVQQGDVIPAELVVSLFVMLYKGARKGTVSAFKAYRPVGLLNHAWKLVEAVMMEELVQGTELFLDPAQDGCRADRGGHSAAGSERRFRCHLAKIYR